MILMRDRRQIKKINNNNKIIININKNAIKLYSKRPVKNVSPRSQTELKITQDTIET